MNKKKILKQDDGLDNFFTGKIPVLAIPKEEYIIQESWWKKLEGYFPRIPSFVFYAFFYLLLVALAGILCFGLAVTN